MNKANKSAKRVRIIAEAGVNHNGLMPLARDLASAARDAGADIVKFQTFDPKSLVVASAGTATYQQRSGYSDQREMLTALTLNEVEHEKLVAHCARIGIEFLSTAFDDPSIDLLSRLGQTTWKIPSGEITNVPLIERIGAIASEVIVSTGMATIAEIDEALCLLDAAGTPRERVTVLHCTTQYPTPVDQVNLRAMDTIAAAFSVSVGYSDHTVGIEVPLAAVARGASIIEKHFTLDKEAAGPDHAASLDPAELAAMVRGIRTVEEALGAPGKTLQPAEAANRQIVRKAIVARRPIAAGEMYTAENITTKRPELGIPARFWHTVLGRAARRAYEEDEPIEW